MGITDVIGNGDSRKFWWFGVALTLMGIIFGAGGSAYLAQDAVARHEQSISTLRDKAVLAEVNQGRIDERLRSIDGKLASIERMLQGRTLSNVSPEI
ncbi:MAG: hypothetical protein A2Y76_01590 [Planctomycetes bacterium RBG_13_60_9]|nr:MAG: hypothetical protein A2Y76_01590 [Planctomycetes bacterium RBG_13_60_9]